MDSSSSSRGNNRNTGRGRNNQRGQWNQGGGRGRGRGRGQHTNADPAPPTAKVGSASFLYRPADYHPDTPADLDLDIFGTPLAALRAPAPSPAPVEVDEDMFSGTLASHNEKLAPPAPDVPAPDAPGSAAPDSAAPGPTPASMAPSSAFSSGSTPSSSAITGKPFNEVASGSTGRKRTGSDSLMSDRPTQKVDNFEMQEVDPDVFMDTGRHADAVNRRRADRPAGASGRKVVTSMSTPAVQSNLREFMAKSKVKNNWADEMTEEARERKKKKLL